MAFRIHMAILGVVLIVVCVLASVGFGPFTGDRYVYEGMVVLSPDAAKEFIAEHPGGIDDVEILEDSSFMIVYDFSYDDGGLPLNGRVDWAAILVAPILTGVFGLILLFFAIFATYGSDRKEEGE